jgi:hypothetical protein
MKDKRFGKNQSKIGTRSAQNRPAKVLYKSHHVRAPGEWMRHGDIVSHKVKNHPTLAQYDGERE